MVTIKLSEKDAATVAKIVAAKAMEMHKKGAWWLRGDKRLSCFDIGELSNKMLRPTGEEFDFNKAFKSKNKIKTT
jgi:hypothetical protein